MFCSLLLSSVLLSVTSAVPLRSHIKYNQPINNSTSNISARALYFIDNNSASNSVYSVKIESNSTLTDGNAYKTGGNGGSILDPDTLEPELRDGLSSTNSVLVNENQLYVVNAGSNTISSFAIDPADPTTLLASNDPVYSGGDFPVAMAVSDQLNTLCVANDGASSGIACFDMTHSGLVQNTPLIPFNLNQTNPPTGSIGNSTTPKSKTRPYFASIQFSTDNTQLIGTILNGGGFDPGYLLSLPIDSTTGKVSANPTYYTPSDTAKNETAIALFTGIQLPESNKFFGLDGRSKIFLIDDFLSSSLNESSTTTEISIPGGLSTCWLTLSNAAGSIYVPDAELNSLFELDPASGELIATYNVTNGKPGMMDLVAAGTQVFALSPGTTTSGLNASITVFDVQAGRGKAVVSQDFEPRGLGVANLAQGMAVWPVSSSS
ncbi:hypothetical protein MMC25_001227 [Agyrium rufum]|nr:hypothetical protein [Agyrium rufum]